MGHAWWFQIVADELGRRRRGSCRCVDDEPAAGRHDENCRAGGPESAGLTGFELASTKIGVIDLQRSRMMRH